MSEDNKSPSPTPGSPEFWDIRYGQEAYGYGEAPNDFVRQQIERAGAAGDVLEIACGEGRNAVFVALQPDARKVVAIDVSPEGIKKTQALAEKHGVASKVEAIAADLSTYDLGNASFDLVISTSAHLPPSIRPAVHKAVVKAMRPGARLVLEAYTPDNIGRGTGGPQNPVMCMTLEALRTELAGLDFVEAQETEREVNEGEWHRGTAAVVQVHAVKPS